MKGTILLFGASVFLALAAWMPIVNAGGPPGDPPRMKNHGKHDSQHHQRHEARASRQRESRRNGDIVGCGDAISEPGHYRLVSDQVCVEAIEINSSNVHLDLAGHSIHCDAHNWIGFPDPLPEDPTPWVTGIQVNTPDFVFPDTNVTRVHIKNGTVSGCAIGIFLHRTENSKVTRMRIAENNFGESNSAIFGHAVALDQSDNNHFSGNRLTNNGNGFVSFSSAGNKYTGNHSEGNTHDGLYLGGSNGNTVVGNTMSHNHGVGVWLEENSDNNRFKGNKINSNDGTGVLIVGSGTGNVFQANTVNQNNEFGIAIAGISIPEFGILIRPGDNLIVANTVRESAASDMVEADAVLDPGTFDVVDLVLADECFNTWENNTFDTSLAPPDCIE